jgi:hypothetical protein
VTIDVLHRERLDELFDSFKISGLSEADKLNVNNCTALILGLIALAGSSA